MSATNHTTSLDLSQFIGTDKPAWLGDYNADMLKIDTGHAENKTSAETANTNASVAMTNAENAVNAVTALNTTVQNLDTSINEWSTTSLLNPNESLFIYYRMYASFNRKLNILSVYGTITMANGQPLSATTTIANLNTIPNFKLTEGSVIYPGILPSYQKADGNKPFSPISINITKDGLIKTGNAEITDNANAIRIGVSFVITTYNKVV